MLYAFLEKLYPEFDELQLTLKQYCLSCISHRVRKFGWEDGINFMQPRDLVALAIQMPEYQKNVLIGEAVERGFDIKSFSESVKHLMSPADGKKG